MINRILKRVKQFHLVSDNRVHPVNPVKFSSRLALIVTLFWLGSNAHADVFRPAYLELRQHTADTYDVLWKVPAQGDMRLALYVRMPAGVEKASEPRAEIRGDSFVERWRIRDAELTGKSISIEGLRANSAEVLVRVARLDGSEQVTRLLPTESSFVVATSPGAFEVARTYSLLGVHHILVGIDHLLFVLALLLIVRTTRRILWTITAFTLAHSITLVAATLGWMSVPGPPVEATIALSIVFLAREIVMIARGHSSVTERWPWVVAFTFGLLHGLGFAGALAEVGLPHNAIPLALFFFNVGVEVGQVLFVAAVLAVLAAYRFWYSRQHVSGNLHPAPAIRMAVTYAIGTLASFWVIERVMAFW